MALRATAQELFSTPVAGALPWEPFAAPGRRNLAFSSAESSGRPALRVRARQSVSILRQRFEPGLNGVGRLRFSWKADVLEARNDLEDGLLEDAPVRIVLAFDGDRSRLSARTHAISELSRLLTGEELPFATLAYVWSMSEPPGTVVKNPRTDRIRKLVVESGTAHSGLWREHERDIRADFIQAFGEPPGPLRIVAIMSDTGDAESEIDAWYGPLKLELASRLAP